MAHQIDMETPFMAYIDVTTPLTSGVIYHEDALTVYGTYSTVGQASRALINAVEKGHKIQGRKFGAEQLDKMIVSSQGVHEFLDIEVEVTSMYGQKVTIRTSQVGNPVYDPSMDSYYSI
jgi:hypothetical protein